MDATFEFSFTGMNMEFVIHLMSDGHSIPEGLFVNNYDRKMSISAPTP